MSNIKYTKELLQREIVGCVSWSDFCRKLGVKPRTGAQTHLKKRTNDFGVCHKHFLGVRELSRINHTNQKKHVGQYLVKNGPSIKSHDLKLRLIRDGIKKRSCECCGLDSWNGMQIPIELHHVDGDHWNNEIENLQILCPNCHSQTSNNSGRGKKCILPA